MDKAAFEDACGVGKVVSPEEIHRAVSSFAEVFQFSMTTLARWSTNIKRTNFTFLCEKSVLLLMAVIRLF